MKCRQRTRNTQYKTVREGNMIPGASKLVQRATSLAYWQNVLDNIENQGSQESHIAHLAKRSAEPVARDD